MTKITLYPFQREDVDKFINEKHEAGLFAYEQALGKAQPLDSQVLTPTGFVRMGDIKVGDTVVAPDGTDTVVMGVYPQGMTEVYELTLDDGRKVKADGNHLWTVANGNDRSRGTRRTKTTVELLETLKTKQGYNNWTIEGVTPYDFGEWKSSVHPYLLGYLLGNGGLTGRTIYVSTADAEVLETIEELLPEGVTAKHAGAYDYRLTSPAGKPNALLAEMQRLGLMGVGARSKHVPRELLNATVEARTALLQGLLDSDGYTNGTGFEFTVASPTLAKDLAYLAHSLGGRARLTTKTIGTGEYVGNEYYRVYGRLPEAVKPFKLSRKAEVYGTGPLKRYSTIFVAITNIEYIGWEETQCIKVSHPDHEYVTDGFVRTHNTLTATTLAVELGTEVNLVIAPQVTFEGWKEAVATQTEGQYELQWMKKNTKAGKAAFGDYYAGKPGWYFITWQLMRNGPLFDTHADMIIGDEIHEIQNKGGSAQNLMIGKINSTYRIGLSGTASGNKLEGIYGIISWLWPKKFKAYWPWLKKHFLLAGYGHALTPIREKKPGSVTSELPFFVRRLKKNHYADMIPAPKPTEEVYVDMTAEQRDIYEEFKATSGAWLGEDEDDGFMYASHSIVKMMRLRELALGTPTMEMGEDFKWVTKFELDTKSAKLDELIKILESPENRDETFVVYTHSKKFIEVVVHRLNERGIKAEAFTGDLNYRQKRKVIDNFGETFRVMVATQASIGTGTDGLQHRCSRMVILSRDVKMIVNEQAAERLYRPGQKLPVQTWEIIANDSNDLDTNANLDYAQEQVSTMLDANTKK